MAKEINNIELVEEITKKLFELLEMDVNLDVYEDSENEAIRVDIKSADEQGLLIGKRGETLFSLQSIISMIVRQRLGDWERIIVNVGDWREKQEDYLGDLAKQAAQRAIDTGEEQFLYNLNPNQRRVVHTTLSEFDTVETESRGEGIERFLVVRPK